MKTDHHNYLKEALKQLPVYEPDQEVWDNISNDLAKNKFGWLARKLPVYQAPDFIWEAISARLDQVQPSSPVIRKIYRYAALVIGVTLGGFLIINQVGKNASGQVSFSTETINNITNIDLWENDEAAFALLDEFCESKGYTCDGPDFLSLKNELDELNMAHNELKTVLTAYNDNPHLIEQLTQIERQRTDLLKTLFAKI